MTPEQLAQLTQPFPSKYVHENPSGGGSYIKHHVIEQRLIQVLGYAPSFQLVEVIRGDVPEIPANPKGSSKRAREGAPALSNVVVGVIARLTVDGIPYEEAGDCEEPHNWKTDGQRLKDAMSDAYKRCAMRLGCGLHLWSQDEYFLYDQLVAGSERASDASTSLKTASSEPKDGTTSSPPTSSEPESSHSPGTSTPPAQGELAGGESSTVSDTAANAVSGTERADGSPSRGKSLLDRLIDAHSALKVYQVAKNVLPQSAKPKRLGDLPTLKESDLKKVEKELSKEGVGA